MGRFKNFFSLYLWGNLLAMLAVVLVVCMLALYGIDVYTHHGEMVEVPNVVGMQETDARYTLGQLELVMVQGEKGFDKSKPTGCILDQTPKAGTKVKEGRQIFLTVNTENSPTRALPDVADNSSLREAQARLKAMGFKLGPVDYIAGDKDWVYGVKCQGRFVYAGEQVPTDVPLILQVGNTSSLEAEEEFLDEIDSMVMHHSDSVVGLDDLFGE